MIFIVFLLDQAANFVMVILKNFYWRHLAILFDESDIASKLMKDSIELEIKNHNYENEKETISYGLFSFKSKDGDPNIFTKILTQMSSIARSE